MSDSIGNSVAPTAENKQDLDTVAGAVATTKLSKSDPDALYERACALHLHSTYSDGTATVPELIDSALAAEIDVLLLTDHDTLGAKRDGWEGYHGEGRLLFGVGAEVTARDGHYLAFGIDDPIAHEGIPVAEIPELVASAGGIGFAAHPFSEGALMTPKRSKRGSAHGWRAIDHPGLAGIELWSLTTDAAEAWANPWQAIRYLRSPEDFLDGPPQRHLDGWDKLCETRRVAAIGGLDAHQNGFRLRGRVVSPMGNARYFRQLSTYALCRRAPTGDPSADLGDVYEALAEGRCYLAVDDFASGRGFRFWGEAGDGLAEMGEERHAGRWTFRAELPEKAHVILRRNGEAIAEVRADRLAESVNQPGVYRLEASLVRRGRERPWIYSNPIYLR